MERNRQLNKTKKYVLNNIGVQMYFPTDLGFDLYVSINGNSKISVQKF